MTHIKILTSAAASSLMAIAVLTAPSTAAQRVTNNVSEAVRQASDLGRIDSAKEMNITVQLHDAERSRLR